MIWLNPRTVTVGAVALGDVRQVSVDEKPERLVVEFGDGGPHAVFCDVPERRAVVKVRRRVLGNEDLGLSVGDAVVFVMRTARAGTDAPGVTVAANVVLTSVSYKVDRADGAEQVIEAVAVSSDGAASPVVVTEDGGA